jgi:hypothetical protein
MRVAKNSRRRRKEEEEEEDEIEEEEEKEEAAAAAVASCRFWKISLRASKKETISTHLQIRTHVRFKNRITMVSTSRKNACAIPPPRCNRITPHPQFEPKFGVRSIQNPHSFHPFEGGLFRKLFPSNQCKITVHSAPHQLSVGGWCGDYNANFRYCWKGSSTTPPATAALLFVLVLFF